MITWSRAGGGPAVDALYLSSMHAPVEAVKVQRTTVDESVIVDDLLVTEEPLEIRLGHGPEDARTEFRMSVTMRTPGHDNELALGFLFSEGLIDDIAHVLRVVICKNVKPEELGNVVRVELHPSVELDPVKWQRNTYTTSSCGVCGKTSIDAVSVTCTRTIGVIPDLAHALITSLPERMRTAQTIFKHTGGIHAAALFNTAGDLLVLREDIGRHNAVDKVIGALLEAALTAEGTIMVVSGRAGFELVQKCTVAGIPMMISVGAPSTLAVQLARERGMRLIGFARDGRYNDYTAVK